MMSPEVTTYWDRFRSETGQRNVELFDVFKIGDTIESADAGLALILDGEKTATSCLPEEFAGSRPPRAGDMSIVTDGIDRPGAVVETTEAVIAPFDEVGEEFVFAYGEWDKTLATWRKMNAGHCAMVCRELGIEWHDKRELVLERFRVIHRNEMIGSALSA